MQFENFDKKVKEAADHHHPAYDNNAWPRMEKLLNKHMPVEEEDRRGLLFIILLFLLLGGGAFFYFNKNRKTGSKEQIAKTEQKPVTTPVNNSSGNSTIAINNTNKPAEENIIRPAVNNKKDVFRLSNKNKITAPEKTFVEKETDVKVIPSDNIPEKAIEKTAITSGEIINKQVELKKPATEATEKKEDAIVKTDKTDVKTEEPQKKKSKSSKSSFFFLSASVGPDISMAGISSPGRMKWVGGIGAGYTYKERFTLRTGFYSARKIYSATPEYYHAPAAFYSYYPNLEKVEADCKVYEIPVTISYNFSRTAKKNLFVSAGLSSYLMKRETYDFYYKYYPTGPTVNRKRTIYNDNQHYFSVATISAGYQRNIGKSLTITAEPYVKIPFQGVGFGKVPLNSGGVLFTIGYKPFQKSTKK